MLKKFLLDLIFPIQCLGGCKTWDTWLCPQCQEKINQKNKITFNNDSIIQGLYYITDYKNKLIQKLIHQFKYSYSQDIASILGQQLSKTIDQEFDYIIPVPLHKKRFLERGFNQAELIANYINKDKILDNVIIRRKNTHAQAQLNEQERLQNTANAFQINSKNNIDLSDKKILLVDDVYTTGNTLTSVAKVLQQKSPHQIWAACVAKG